MEVTKARRITQRFLTRVRDSSPSSLPRLKFATLSPMLRDAVFVVDAEGKIAHWNKAAENTFGYLRSEIVRQPFYKLILPAQDIHEINIFLKEAGPWLDKELETVLFHKNGQAIKIKLHFSPAQDRKKWCMIGVAHPINSREVGVEEALKRAEMLSRRAVLGEVSAGVLHDMSNSMCVLSLSTGYLEEAITAMYNALLYDLDLQSALKEREAIAKTLRDFARVTAKMDTAARNFMNFGARSMVVQSFYPSRVLAQVIKLMRPNLIAKDVRFYDDIVPDLPCINGDPGYFEQIIYNLMINALHASEQKGEIWVKAYSMSSTVLIEISDTGSGIAPEIRERIFDPFFSTKGLEKGTGLGLSLARKFMELMGGQINFESEVNQGTTFTLTMPYESQES